MEHALTDPFHRSSPIFDLIISKSHYERYVGATENQFRTPFKKGLFTTMWNALPKDDEDPKSITFRRVIGLPFVRMDGQNYERPIIEIHPGPYEYRSKEWYVIFANRNLGGGYLNKGFVQEEILMLECPELSVVVANFNPESPLQPEEVGIYQNIDRVGTITIYGNKQVDAFIAKSGKRVDYKDIFDKEVTTGLNFLAMDAVNVSGKKKASPEDVKYMLEKAISGFASILHHGATSVNSGKWGAGIFGNDISTIFTITYLAAWKVGLPNVKFYLYDGTGKKEVESLLPRLNAASYTDIEKKLYS